jgi:hypothetical protein
VHNFLEEAKCKRAKLIFLSILHTTRHHLFAQIVKVGAEHKLLNRILLCSCERKGANTEAANSNRARTGSRWKRTRAKREEERRARSRAQEEKAEKADMNCRLCMYSQFIFNEMEHQRCTAPLTSYFYERARSKESLKTGHCRSLRS